jgi:hypothetical protein
MVLGRTFSAVETVSELIHRPYVHPQIISPFTPPPVYNLYDEPTIFKQYSPIHSKVGKKEVEKERSNVGRKQCFKKVYLLRGFLIESVQYFRGGTGYTLMTPVV